MSRVDFTLLIAVAACRSADFSDIVILVQRIGTGM